MEDFERRGAVVVDFKADSVDLPEPEELLDRGSERARGMTLNKAKYILIGAFIGAKAGLDAVCITNNPIDAALTGWNAFKPFL